MFEMPAMLLLPAAFVFGTMIGSFLNVCIHRIPGGESIVFPASHCPACGAAVRPYDNVPVLSYLLLRARCRDCGSRISARYPAIELLAGMAAVSSALAFGWSLHALFAFVFLAALIVITFIDIDHQIIPDVISLPGIAIGFACASLVPGGAGWRDSLIGLLVGGGILWAVAEGYFRLTGREGMGGGDVKLLAMIGAFLGWRAIPITLMIGSLAGTAVGTALIATQQQDRRTPIPFGPFLALGAVLALFFGDALLDWYLGLMRPGA
jgi:leader peptidase (prepilin peptidase) / N-methyltransferase